MKSLLTAAAIVILLTACTSYAPEQRGLEPISRIGVDGYNPLLVSSTNPHFPNVTIDVPYVIVDQEPIHIRTNELSVKIVWALPFTSSFHFPEDGVVLKPAAGVRPPTNLVCIPIGDSKRRFQCSYDRSGRGKYTYTLKVTDGTNVYESDPTIMNN